MRAKEKRRAIPPKRRAQLGPGKSPAAARSGQRHESVRARNGGARSLKPGLGDRAKSIPTGPSFPEKGPRVMAAASASTDNSASGRNLRFFDRMARMPTLYS